MEKWRNIINQEDVRDMAYGCSLASQAGLGIAGPVIIGMAAGYWLDLRLDTLPWITLLLTAGGAIIGPVVVYRWVTAAMRQRFADREQADVKEENQA